MFCKYAPESRFTTYSAPKEREVHSTTHPPFINQDHNGCYHLAADAGDIAHHDDADDDDTALWLKRMSALVVMDPDKSSAQPTSFPTGDSAQESSSEIT